METIEVHMPYERKLPVSGIPHVKDCIEYVAHLGWRFEYYNTPWYVFVNPNRTTWNGSHELNPILNELRDMYKNGF